MQALWSVLIVNRKKKIQPPLEAGKRRQTNIKSMDPTGAEKKKRVPKGSRPPSMPRGPPRPHRKLPVETLEGRITKLDKRIKKAKMQLEDAERHIEVYLKESKYRLSDPPPLAADPE